VVFVALLPAWTLGLGSALGTAEATALALLTWLLTVVASDALARRGRRGPAETLLRRLTYGTSLRTGGTAAPADAPATPSDAANPPDDPTTAPSVDRPLR